MPTPYPLKNQVLLTIEKAFIEEITTKSGFKLYLVPEYEAEKNATVQGKIASLPRNYNGNLKVGDEVAFSYKVVSDRTFPNTSDFFVPLSEGNTNVRIWQNSKGEKLRMVAHQGVVNMFWVATYFNSKGQFEYGNQGTESEMERWLHSNFKFGNCESFAFKNLIQVDGENYWKCPLDQIFAKKENNKVIAVGDRVICKIIDVPARDLLKKIGNLHVPASSVMFRYFDRGRVSSGGEKLGIKKGNTISFDDKYCEKYSLFGEDYFLIRERRIVGQWLNKKVA